MVLTHSPFSSGTAEEMGPSGIAGHAVRIPKLIDGPSVRPAIDARADAC